MGNQIDEAFSRLVLILSALSGVLISLPDTMEVKKTVALGLIPPLLALVVVWLFSHLTERTPLQVILKTYAWFFSSFMFLVLIFVFAYVTSPLFVALFFGGGALFPWVIWIMVVSFFVAPFLFYVIMIQPKYRRIYSDSKFLASRLQPVLLYILALATFILIIGLGMTGADGILKLLL